MTSIRKTPNMKVVNLRKLWNFVTDKLLIWIRLVPQKTDLHSCSIIWVESKLHMDTYECVV
jgi:hypothetical protein